MQDIYYLFFFWKSESCIKSIIYKVYISKAIVPLVSCLRISVDDIYTRSCFRRHSDTKNLYKTISALHDVVYDHLLPLQLPMCTICWTEWILLKKASSYLQIHIFKFTYREKNCLQKKSIGQDMNI